MGRRQFLHPTGSGMESQLQFVKGKTAANIDDEFAIEDEFFRGQARKRICDVREIASERLTRFRLQKNFVPAAKGEAAETIPFRFILPAIPGGNLVNRAGLHWC